MCRQNPSNTTTSLGVVLSMSCWVVWGVARLADAVLSRGKITFYRRAVCAYFCAPARLFSKHSDGAEEQGDR